MYWHTSNRGDTSAPSGWKVERRHFTEGDFVVRSWEFLGANADALQTFSSKYWDWTDTSASSGTFYTYRVHAVDSSGNELSGRKWSRRATVMC